MTTSEMLRTHPAPPHVDVAVLARAVEAGRTPGRPRGSLAAAASTVLAELARITRASGRSAS